MEIDAQLKVERTGRKGRAKFTYRGPPLTKTLGRIKM
jgi:hypothetical protein